MDEAVIGKQIRKLSVFSFAHLDSQIREAQECRDFALMLMLFKKSSQLPIGVGHT